MRRALLPLLLLGATACDARAPAGDDGKGPPPIVRVAEAGSALPSLTGRVVDGADLLKPAAEAGLAARLEALERETSDQLVVVTLPTLGGEPIEQFGRRLGNGWGVGQKELDNGVLLIVAAGDRKARIAVGTGLEGLLTDARADRIMKEDIVPNCAQGRCDRAIEEGAAAIVAVLRSDRRRPQPRDGARR